ncbi:MAG: sulfatase-like hydrolase/transferase [Halovenus sp.]
MTERHSEATGTGRAPNRPNIVLVTADSIRADHCGFLNDDIGTTPTLDALARDGLVFENAIAPGPRTPSSLPVLWTGEHVGHENKQVYTSRREKKERWQERRQRIRRHVSRFETVAERMSRRGYDTGAITANPWTTRDTGFDQGFTHFVEVDSVPTDGALSPGKRLLSKASALPGVPDTGRWLLTWTDFYDHVLETRRKLLEPYFLWVFLLDSHQPYFAPSDYRTENTSVEMYYANAGYNYSHTAFEELPDRLRARFEAAYRDTIRSVDGFVEQLLADIGADDPAVVFHADHGEAMMEHGTRGHRPELYDENLRVPLLAHNVGRSGCVTDQVALRQLPGFLLSIAGRDPEPDRVRQDSLVAKTEEDERVTVRTADWKRIDSDDHFHFAHASPMDELYHLESDPGERDNVFENQPSVVENLDRRLARHDSALDERRSISAASRELARNNSL